jgi:hypothetical protein
MAVGFEKRQGGIPPLLRLRHRADGGYPRASCKDAQLNSGYGVSGVAIDVCFDKITHTHGIIGISPASKSLINSVCLL